MRNSRNKAGITEKAPAESEMHISKPFIPQGKAGEIQTGVPKVSKAEEMEASASFALQASSSIAPKFITPPIRTQKTVPSTPNPITPSTIKIDKSQPNSVAPIPNFDVSD